MNGNYVQNSRIHFLPRFTENTTKRLNEHRFGNIMHAHGAKLQDRSRKPLFRQSRECKHERAGSQSETQTGRNGTLFQRC